MVANAWLSPDAETAVTMPEVEPITTFDALLDQTPPVTVFARVAALPGHIAETPVISAGNWFTVSVAMA